MGYASFAGGYATKAKGSYSTAMGVFTTSGDYASTALGSSTTAGGFASTALGDHTTASGTKSTATGEFTTASGASSTAMGVYTTAPSGYETAIGRYNTSYTPNSTTGWDTSDRLFTIGNGTANNSRSDAMVILKSGKIGIGTSTPGQQLEILTPNSNSLQIPLLLRNLNSIDTGGTAVGMGFYNESATGRVPKAAIVNERTGSYGRGSIHFLNNNKVNASGVTLADAKMTITKEGYVGIGTRTPDTTLHLVGKFKYQDGTQANGYVLTSDSSGNAAWASPASVVSSQVWSLTGNSGTTPGTNFIGTTDNTDLVFKVNNNYAGLINAAGGLNTSLGLTDWAGTGSKNSAFGFQTLGPGTTGNNNSIFGWNIMTHSTTAHDNTAIGFQTMVNTTTGSYNNTLGALALFSNSTGLGNTAIGHAALTHNTTGSFNVALGVNAGLYDSTGNNSVFVGFQAGRYNSGTANVFLGFRAGENETGSNKLYIANSAADSANALIYGEFDNKLLAVNGTLRVNDGTQANGYVLTSDSSGNASWAAPATLSDADNDTKIQVEKSSDDDIIRFDMAGTEFFRMDSGRLEVVNTGYSVFIGEYAGAADNFNFGFNVGVGASALEENTTGTFNVAIGTDALARNVDGENNVAVGGLSLTHNKSGYINTALGNNTLEYNTTGIGNTAIGSYALESNRTGAGNVALGYNAGRSAIGSNNVFLGVAAGQNATGSNKLYIANSDADSAHALIYGEFDNKLLAVNGTLRVKDGTQANGYVLTSDSAGNATWAAPSSIISSVFDVSNSVVIPGSAVNINSYDFVFGSTQLNNDGSTNHDKRFFFDKGKGAFRAGENTNNVWNNSYLGDASFASGYNTKASGDYATAMGKSTLASGNNSFAIGDGPNATGQSAVAMGVSTKATGDYSTALGRSTTAGGHNSTSMGYQVTAPSAFETSIGLYNTGYTPNSTLSWNLADRLFTVGNGSSDTTRANAMVILKSGNTGIGTSMPDTTLHVAGKFKYQDGTQTNGYVLTSDSTGNATWAAPSSVIVSVFDTLNGVVLPGNVVNINSDDFVFGSGQLNDDGSNNHARRFFFDKSKAAFRAGEASGPNWNEDSLGISSFASGYNTIAGGSYSTAMGFNTRATGDYSSAIGHQTTASGTASTAMGVYSAANGIYSTAMGYSDTASGDYSTAMGYSTTASGIHSVAMGKKTIASGIISTAMGYGTTASGIESLAMGAETIASGINSTAMGVVTEASGDNSTAMGAGTKASGQNSTAIGQYSKARGFASTAIGSYTDASGSFATSLGRNTTAPSGYETTVGQYNTSYTPNSTTGWDTNDRLFTIGNGTDYTDKSDALVVLKNGRVGIGTSIPNTNLDIETSDTLTDARLYNNNGNGTGRLYVGSNGGGHINLIANSTGTDVYGIPAGLPGIATQYKAMIFATGNGANNSTEKMRLTTDGKLGVGTVSPNYTLQVGNSGDGTEARANAWNTFSDRRWKKDFEIIPDALDKLQQVNGYYYYWKQGVDTTQQVGIIAQEIEKILPQCVSTDKDGYKSVDYSKLTAWLIQVNKEQQQQIESQTEQIKTLRLENDAAKSEWQSEKTSTEERLQRLENLLLNAKAER